MVGREISSLDAPARAETLSASSSTTLGRWTNSAGKAGERVISVEVLALRVGQMNRPRLERHMRKDDGRTENTHMGQSASIPTRRPRAGSTGGSAAEAGGLYRRSVAAVFVAYALNGTPFPGLPVRETDAVVDAVGLETDFAVDDILVQLRSGKLLLQAKRTLTFARPMRQVATQWLAAVRERDFRSSTDLVGAVGGTLSNEVRNLAEGLSRLRAGATVFPAGQSRALGRLRTLLGENGAADCELTLVLARAVVLPMHAEYAQHEHAERGRLLLDGHVVRTGVGTRAWRELVHIAGEAACSQLTYSVDGWLEQLRRREVPLATDDSTSRATHLESRREAVERYRLRLQRRGDYVDLTTIGLRVPPIPLCDMDAGIDVRAPDAEDRDSQDLFWSVRLCGRVVLTGLPGSGKSTAVARIVAQWARRRQWALPVAVSLRRLAERDRFRKRSLRDNILTLATEIADPADRALIREALENALSSGQVALFLDGLDEAADRSLEMAGDIGQMLEEVHADTDVLLATRDAAYADAQILGFRDLRLCRPRNAVGTVTSVLQAIASQRNISDSREWVERRVAWVRRLFKADSQLEETPLIPVLLASLAADCEAEALPQTRARILEQVVRSVVAQREVRREVEISGVWKAHQTDVVVGAFPIIGAALEGAGGSATRERLVEPVGRYLETEWGLAPAVARASAVELLVFWDESGIFVASGSGKVVAPRLQVFLEVGSALYATTMSTDDVTSWVAECAAKADRGDTLVLAAGLSEAVAVAVIERAVRGSGAVADRLALEAARALAEGGRCGEAHVGRLVERLLAIVRRGGEEAWSAAQAVTRVRVPRLLEGRIVGAIRGSLPAEHAVVATAEASVAWEWAANRCDRALEEVLKVERLPRLGPPSIFGDRTLDRVRVVAATRLLPGRPDLAGVVAAAMRHAGMRAGEELGRVLVRNGHGEVASAARRSTQDVGLGQKMERMWRRMDEDCKDTLGALVKLAPPRVLGLSQARRLSELASFMETLNLNDVSGWLRGKRWDELRGEWIDAIATLGGFDKGTIAAQAAIVEREAALGPEWVHSPFMDLFRFGKEAELNRWDRLSNRESGWELLLRVLCGPRGAAMVAARGLAEHPDKGGTAERVRGLWDGIARECVVFAVWCYVQLLGEGSGAVLELMRSPNDNVREGLAQVGALVENGEPTVMAVGLARDAVRQVRLAVIRRLEAEVEAGKGHGMVELLEEIEAAGDVAFTCYHCETVCDAGRDACRSCRVVTERSSVAAARVRKAVREQDEGGARRS